MTAPGNARSKSLYAEVRESQEKEGPLMEVAGLSKSFGPTRALHDFSYDFMRGTVYAVVGEFCSGTNEGRYSTTDGNGNTRGIMIQALVLRNGALGI